MTDEQRSSGHGMWPTFFAMIATSIVTMFVLKYSALWELDHAFFSQTRMWMALMMGMAMIVIMLGFMRRFDCDMRGVREARRGGPGAGAGAR